MHFQVGLNFSELWDSNGFPAEPEEMLNTNF